MLYWTGFRKRTLQKAWVKITFNSSTKTVRNSIKMYLPSSQNSSKARLRYLAELHAFVTAATKELMWLNEKEEEEVNYDWSERNTNMAAKKENYSVEWRHEVLMRVLSTALSSDVTVMWLLLWLFVGSRVWWESWSSGRRRWTMSRPPETNCWGTDTRPGARWRWEHLRWRLQSINETVEILISKRLTVTSSGLHCSPADSVELDPPAVLLHRNTPERKHCLLPGVFTYFISQSIGKSVPLFVCFNCWTSLSPISSSSSFSLTWRRRRTGSRRCRTRWRGSTPATAPSQSRGWRTYCRTQL